MNISVPVILKIFVKLPLFSAIINFSKEYEKQKDESDCKMYGWTCQEGRVPNPACQSECDRKQTEYENIQSNQH